MQKDWFDIVGRVAAVLLIGALFAGAVVMFLAPTAVASPYINVTDALNKRMAVKESRTWCNEQNRTRPVNGDLPVRAPVFMPISDCVSAGVDEKSCKITPNRRRGTCRIWVTFDKFYPFHKYRDRTMQTVRFTCSSTSIVKALRGYRYHSRKARGQVCFDNVALSAGRR